MSHPRLPAIYRRNLPHIQPPGATLFITFHLAGSLPREVAEQWKKERQWLTYIAKTSPSHYECVKVISKERGSLSSKNYWTAQRSAQFGCATKELRGIVAESLHHRDGKVYRLDACSIMPNHVHTVIKPLPIREGEDEYHALASIMQSLKGYTSFKCNRLLGQEGEFWAHESYDHWVRDADEWQRIVAYVVNNPVKAGYVERWQEWKWNYRRV